MAILKLIKSHRYLAIFVVVLCLGVLTGAALGLSRRRMRRPQVPRSVALSVPSRTYAIQVLESHLVPVGGSSLLVVKVQNVSGKKIKAITVGSGNRWITENLLLGDESLAPGAYRTISLPFSNDANGNVEGTALPYDIAAVLFEDGSGDGQQRHVNILCDKYAGMRSQARRALPRLDKLSTKVTQDSAMTDVENEARALPTAEQAVSQDYADGLREARSWLLTQLGEIKQRRQTNLVDEADKKQEKLKRVFRSLAHLEN